MGNREYNSNNQLKLEDVARRQKRPSKGFGSSTLDELSSVRRQLHLGNRFISSPNSSRCLIHLDDKFISSTALDRLSSARRQPHLSDRFISSPDSSRRMIHLGDRFISSTTLD
uniref:Uncharacterized protein n=1 Tax=Noccaea caerulescens TaxID=107243 RepID=A0A1J3IDZ4_NOCCA